MEVINNKTDAIKIFILKRITAKASISVEYPPKLRLKKFEISLEFPI